MRHRPLLCGVAGLVAGIGVWAGGAHSAPLMLALGVVGAALLAWGRPALALAGLVLAGAAVGGLRLASFNTVAPNDISHWADAPAPVRVAGVVADDPQRRAGRLSFTLRPERLETRGQTLAVSGLATVMVPGDGADVDYGDEVRVDGFLETPPDATNPGAFSWRAYLARREIYCTLRPRRLQSVQALGGSVGNPALRFAWNARHRVLASIGRSLPALPAAVLSGLLIGDRSGLPPALMDDFVRTGTVHILASAGLHVGIVAFWLWLLCERLTLPRKTSAVLVIASLALYALICGGRPSVTRAVVMASVYFAATLFERDPDLPTTVAAAALLILLVQPTALLETGFQMSFLTVLTLAVGMPVWNAFWHGRVQRLFRRPFARKAALWGLELTGLALLAQIGSLPITLRDYNELSVLGVLANLLVVPVLFLLVPLGFAGALAGMAWTASGAALLWPCAGLLAWIVGVVQACAAPVWASIAAPPPSPAWIAVYYAIVLGGLGALHPKASRTAGGEVFGGRAASHGER